MINEINEKLDELTILCSEITLRVSRTQALKIIRDIRNFRITEASEAIRIVDDTEAMELEKKNS